MKPIWRDMCLAATIGLVIPGMMVATAVSIMAKKEDGEIQFTPTDDPVVTETTEPAFAQPEQTIPVKISEVEVVQMNLDSYLTGVVLAEMPISFHEEALKAQAVVARTYAVRACEGRSKHADAAVCVDSSCCQAYMSEETYRAKGGTSEDVEKACNAVASTQNQVLTYDNALIEATYFSCSGGSTEDAVAVWGTDVPYLQATDSPGEEAAAHYSDLVRFSVENFSKALGITLSGSPDSWIGSVSYTAGGGVDTIRIGGTEFKGTAVRKALGLRSTAFSMKPDSEGILVTTKGFGHRVGMSQYGADAMAAGGSTYEEILTHYYQGTVLQSWCVDNGGVLG